jgi:hypothetical protein
MIERSGPEPIPFGLAQAAFFGSLFSWIYSGPDTTPFGPVAKEGFSSRAEDLRCGRADAPGHVAAFPDGPADR